MAEETTTTTAEAPPAAPAPSSDRAKAEDAIYDAAFAETMGAQPTSNGEQRDTPPAPKAETTQQRPSQPAGEPPGEPTGALEGGGLSDEQRQLLSRSHITEDMIAEWSPEQRAAFFSNAAKREADTTKGYQSVRQQLDELREASAALLQQVKDQQATPGAQTTENGTEPRQTGEQPSAGSLTEQAQQVVESLAEVYGEEMRPLATVIEAVDQQVRALQAQAASVPVMEGMLAQLAVEVGISNLVGDYPSLSKSDARQQVIDRFEADWRTSPHRTNTDLPYLDRLRAGIKDAAAAVFGSVTETAAQVSLANKTKERLSQQPPSTTSGRNRAAPKTEDEVYDDAFEKHLAPEMRR